MNRSVVALVNALFALCLTRARLWTRQLVLAVVMAASTLATGCASTRLPLPAGIPQAQVRDLCWTPAAVDS